MQSNKKIIELEHRLKRIRKQIPIIKNKYQKLQKLCNKKKRESKCQ